MWSAGIDPPENLRCIFRQAQAGDFRNVGQLLELAEKDPRDRVRDCAIDLFAMAAPSDELGALTRLFGHPDLDTRLTVYRAVVRSATLDLAGPLARRRAHVVRTERERIMDRLSDMLEPDQEDLELVDSPLNDEDYIGSVEARVAALVEEYGARTAIFRGAPLDANAIVSAISELCAEDEPACYGGTMEDMFAILEGLTGWSYAGCIDEDCAPILPKIAQTLDALRQSGKLDGLEPGRRYFFGHPVP